VTVGTVDVANRRPVCLTISAVDAPRGRSNLLLQSCRFDANREYVDPNRPIGEDEIEIVAVQAAFPPEITAEIEGIIPGLEADEIVFAKRSSKGDA
jgi:hypothetical protein